MSAGADNVITKNELVGNLLHKEIDHLNWANKVAALITDDNVTELSVQTDDHQCAFGQWLYGEGRERAEQEIPELAPILKEIEGSHHALHASAIEIAEHFQQADAELPGIVAARMIGHFKWADVVRDAFLGNKTSVEVQTDPTRCALGQWVQTDKAAEARENGSAEFKAVWDQMLVAHAKLHESAVRLCQRFTEGQQGRIEAKKVFDEELLPLLHETLAHLESIKTTADQALAGRNQANEVFTTKTTPCLQKVQGLLDQATRTVSKIVTERNADMRASAKSTKWSVSILSLAAILIGVSGAALIARSIISALKRIIQNLKEGSEQVASASGQVSSASQSLADQDELDRFNA